MKELSSPECADHLVLSMCGSTSKSDSKVRYITSLKHGDMGIRGAWEDTLETLPEDTL